MPETEQTAEATGTETAATEQQTETDPKPTETVDFWKTKAREQEKRAKENATAAKRLAEIEESQKTEAQKSADRIKALEDQVATAERDALRFKVASKYGIGDEDTDLFLTASDEETLQKQAERLVGRQAEQKKQGNRVPSEGTNPQAKPDEMRDFARQLFDKAD
jgi:hypothetical protein